MRTIFAQLLYEMEKANDTVLVTLIADTGSTPRGSGSQMLVGRHGRLTGTIGGGAVEKRSEEMALALLAEKRSALHTFQLHKNSTEDIGMVCGGDVTALFQFIPGTDEKWNHLAKEIMRCCEQKEPATLILKLNGSTAALIDEDGALLAGKRVENGENTYSMPLPLGERAVIFGAGHIAQALVPLLKSVDFRPVVFDCRPEFATKERFPDAEAVIVGDFDNIATSLELKHDDYIVIMTQGHSHDFEVEAQALRGDYAYVGVIGSAKKMAFVNRRLMEAGVAEEKTRTVHTPIGTAIKAVTPAEIAVSIAGEMICERATMREGKR